MEKKGILKGTFLIPIIGVALSMLMGFEFVRMRPTYEPSLSEKCFELFILAWLPFCAFAFSRPGVPKRWWIYFGLVSYIITLPQYWGFVHVDYCTAVHSFTLETYRNFARDAILLLAYFVLAPFVASILKAWFVKRPSDQ